MQLFLSSFGDAGRREARWTTSASTIRDVILLYSKEITNWRGSMKNPIMRPIGKSFKETQK
jgi:hypothetical protein